MTSISSLQSAPAACDVTRASVVCDTRVSICARKRISLCSDVTAKLTAKRLEGRGTTLISKRIPTSTAIRNSCRGIQLCSNFKYQGHCRYQLSQGISGLPNPFLEKQSPDVLGSYALVLPSTFPQPHSFQSEHKTLSFPVHRRDRYFVILFTAVLGQPPGSWTREELLYHLQCALDGRRAQSHT